MDILAVPRISTWISSYQFWISAQCSGYLTDIHGLSDTSPGVSRICLDIQQCAGYLMDILAVPRISTWISSYQFWISAQCSGYLTDIHGLSYTSPGVYRICLDIPGVPQISHGYPRSAPDIHMDIPSYQFWISAQCFRYLTDIHGLCNTSPGVSRICLDIQQCPRYLMDILGVLWISIWISPYQFWISAQCSGYLTDIHELSDTSPGVYRICLDIPAVRRISHGYHHVSFGYPRSALDISQISTGCPTRLLEFPGSV
ncbi:hypothetical protein BDZ89DRAFT_1127933 [Hymenopellis radicata]|nr:hypothetical protein BDZ89DRAFT_1127933 [Hymenopellis radicata]